MRDTERVAKAVVEAELMRSRMIFNKDQSSGEHDFDLILAGGGRGVVEVTRAADESIHRATAAIFRGRSGGNPVMLPDCEGIWLIEVSPAASINRLRLELNDALADLERSGIDRFLESDLNLAGPTKRLTEELRVRGGARWRANGPGRAYLQVEGSADIIDPNRVTSAVLEVAARADNQRKVTSQAAGERHLFVYVDDTLPDAWVALSASTPPAGGFELPAAFTHVWAAAHHLADGRVVYWLGDHRGWYRSDQIEDPLS